MQLVIDIPKEAYDFIKRTGYHTQSLYEAIKNGIPLPDNSINEDISRQLRNMGKLPKLQPHPPAYEKRGLIK